MKLSDNLDGLGSTVGKFSNGGWSWNEADSLDAPGLTVGKFSDGGWS